MKDELNQTEIDELYDYRNFARLRKQVLADLSSSVEHRNIFLKKHPRDKILKALLCPDKPSSEKMLREISHFFYAVSPHYRRAITMLATLMLNNYLIRPVGDTGNKGVATFNKEYRKLCRTVSHYKLKSYLPQILTTCLLDGVFFGIEYDDTDNYFIKPVRPEFCIITSVENGVWRFSFDLDYFTQKTLRYLPEYGRDFEAAYWAYRGKKDLEGKWIIQPDKTKRWFEPKKQICVKFDPEMDWTIPPFVGIFKSIIDLDTYEEIKKDGAILDNYKLIHYRIPTDTDGVPKLSFEQASKYYNLTANQVPEGIGVAMSPFGLDTVTLKDSNDATKNYTKDATKDLFNNFGIAPVLFGIMDNVTSQSLELAIRPVESMMMKIIRQVQHVYNVKIQKMDMKNLFEICFLEQSIYTFDSVQNYYLKAAQYGMCSKLYYAASLGLEPIDVINQSYLENDILKCCDKIFNRPLISSNTLSNGGVEGESGRPTEENPTDNTESNENTSNEYK